MLNVALGMRTTNFGEIFTWLLLLQQLTLCISTFLLSSDLESFDDALLGARKRRQREAALLSYNGVASGGSAGRFALRAPVVPAICEPCLRISLLSLNATKHARRDCRTPILKATRRREEDHDRAIVL